MPRYYCDYCDTYLTHDSPSVRKQHNAGYKHKANVRSYYQQFEEQQTQSLIDQRIKEHLGQAAAFQQVGTAFNQHLLAQRPRLPVLPTPFSPPGATPLGMPPMVPGMRAPVLPRPVPGAPPGYLSAPLIQQPVQPPGAPGIPGQQLNGLPRPPTLTPPSSGAAGTTWAPGPPMMAPPPSYKPNSAAAPPPSSTGFDNFNGSSQPPEANRESHQFTQFSTGHNFEAGV